VIVLVQILLRLLAELVALGALAFKPRLAAGAEILFLRRQLALFKERGIKPRRIDPQHGSALPGCLACAIGAPA